MQRLAQTFLLAGLVGLACNAKPQAEKSTPCPDCPKSTAEPELADDTRDLLGVLRVDYRTLYVKPEAQEKVLGRIQATRFNEVGLWQAVIGTQGLSVPVVFQIVNTPKPFLFIELDVCLYPYYRALEDRLAAIAKLVCPPANATAALRATAAQALRDAALLAMRDILQEARAVVETLRSLPLKPGETDTARKEQIDTITEAAVKAGAEIFDKAEELAREIETAALSDLCIDVRDVLRRMMEAFNKAVGPVQALLLTKGACEPLPEAPKFDPEFIKKLLPELFPAPGVPVVGNQVFISDDPTLISRHEFLGEVVTFYEGTCRPSRTKKIVRACEPYVIVDPLGPERKVWVRVSEQEPSRCGRGSGVCVETPKAGTSRLREEFADDKCTQRISTDALATTFGCRP